MPAQRMENRKPIVQAPTIAELVDTSRYPIDRPNDPTLQEVIAAARVGLAQDGCARIPGFVRPDVRARLERETVALGPDSLYSSAEYTPYGTGPDESFPEGHPRRRAFPSTCGHVPRDVIPEDTAIQQIYNDPDLKAFIAACLETSEIHQFADPMRGLIINTMQEGHELGWHFDANEFVVTLMTRRAEEGGAFEYCPGLRSPGDENFDAVRDVLDGDRERVKRLDLQVGDLQLFLGRYSMHRVTRVDKGARDTVVLGYSREPGFIGNVASTKRIYGRVTQAHIDAEQSRHTDGLAD